MGLKEEEHDLDMSEVPAIESLPSLPQSHVAKDAYILVTKNADGRLVGTTNGNIDVNPTRKEFSEACILRRDGAGNYYRSGQAFNRIEIPSELKTPAEKFQFRKRIWDANNQKLGITGSRIYFDSDEKNAFQAGAELPHIMIKAGDGRVVFFKRTEKDQLVGKGFQEFREQVGKLYGTDAEIKLRSETGIMHDANYLEAWEKGEADIRFRGYVGEYITHNKTLPSVTVNMGALDDGVGGKTPDRHVSIDALRLLTGHDNEHLANNAKDWIRSLEKGHFWDRILIRTPDGNGYKTPQRLDARKPSDKEYAAKMLKEADLPPDIAEQRHASTDLKYKWFDERAPVLAHVGPSLRALAEVTGASREKTLADPKSLMIADRNSDGKRTGTYTSLAEYERKLTELPNDAAEALGLPANVYSKNQVRPASTTRPVYDDRKHNAVMSL